MPRTRYKPTVNAICKIGTLSHNRSFTSEDALSYGASPKLLQWLRKHKHIRKVSGRSWYPTKKGWQMLDKACTGRRK